MRKSQPVGVFGASSSFNDMENLKKQLEQERAELNALISKGVSFEVDDVEVGYRRSFFGLIKKPVLSPVKRVFTIKEPTLGTLDRLSSEWVEMAINEEEIKAESGLRQARILVQEQSVRCAKVIAIAVLGSDYLIPAVSGNGCVRYTEDVARLEELTALFARTIKPSELYQIYSLISAMCNFGDFLNSIRLMSADRTTTPTRIEENKEA